MSEGVRRTAGAIDAAVAAAQRMGAIEAELDKQREERDAVIAQAVIDVGCTVQQVARATGYSVSLIRHIVGVEKTLRSRGL